MAVDQAFFGSFQGKTLINNTFDIQGVGAAPTGTHFDWVTTTAMTSNWNNQFSFNTAYDGGNVCFFNSAAGSTFFNWQLLGNADTACGFFVNGVTATSGQLRYFMNGIRQGTL